MKEIMKQEALNYVKHGIPVLPVMTKKNFPVKGIVGTVDEGKVNSFWTLNLNIGMPTGKQSGILVVSFDSDKALTEAQGKGLPVTPMLTRGKGYDVYFKYSDGIEDRMDKDVISGMSVLGERKYAILPPSVVELQPPSALYQPEVYSWIEGSSIAEVQLAQVPTWMFRDQQEITTEAEEAIVDVATSEESDDLVEAYEPRTKETVPDDLPTVTNLAELNHEWQPPKLFDRYHVDEVKADVLPSWLGDYARSISQSKQTPEGLAVMLGLSMIATCVQKKFVVAPHGDDEYTEQLALWTVTVMNSAERKSPILNAMREPLVSWQKEQAELLKDRILETGSAISIAERRIERLSQDAAKKEDADERENILNQINKIKREMPIEVKAPVLWTSDVTAETLQDMLADHGERMSVLSDEGNIFEIMGGLYSENKVNIDIFLQAYTGSPARIMRKMRKVDLESPVLTFGLAVQPVVIEGFNKGSKKDFRGKGALGRFLYCIPESMLGKRDSCVFRSIATGIPI